MQLKHLAAFAAVVFAAAMPSAQQQQTLPSERPAQFKTETGSWEYTRREAMIPMRDGVKLHTVILVPKGARRAGITPVLFDVADLYPQADCLRVRSLGELVSKLREQFV